MQKFLSTPNDQMTFQPRKNKWYLFGSSRTESDE